MPLCFLSLLLFLASGVYSTESPSGLAAENPVFKNISDELDYPAAVPEFTKINHLKFRIHPIDTIVIHWIGEGTAPWAVRWFHDPKSRVSAHFVIDRKGKVSQVVKTRDTAWHCTKRTDPPGGMNNPRTIGIEHEATIAHPEWWFSDEMLKSSADLCRFLCQKYNIPMRFGCPGILGHSNMEGCSDKNCPGNFPWERFWFYLTGHDRLDFYDVPAEKKTMKATVILENALLKKKGDPASETLKELTFGDSIELTGQYKDWYTARIPGDTAEGFIPDAAVWFPRLNQ